MQFPDKMFLSLTELAAWLNVDAKTVRRHVRNGFLPAGVPLNEGGKPVWSREAAAVSAWLLAHQRLFVKEPVKAAILGGFEDAAQEINERAAKLAAPAEDAPKPVNRIESSNGKAKGGVR